MKKFITLCTAAVLALSLLSGCAGGMIGKEDEQEPVDLAAFAQTVMESHEFPGFMERIDPSAEETGEFIVQMLDNSYPGLTDLDLEQMEIYMSMISFSGGELALVEAKSADDAAKVQEIFQARVDAKSTDGPGNYPDEVEMWQRNADVVTNGSYVMLVCAQDCDAIVNEFNALFNG